jgi:hypothetical protein
VLLCAGVAHAQTAIQESGLRSCYEANGAETVCSGTGQDGDLRPGAEWPAPRWIDHGNGTVTDRLTDLMWLQDAGCFVGNWFQALTFNATLNGGVDMNCVGYTPGIYEDWHLPSVVELATLIDFGTVSGLPEDHPFVNVGVDGCFTWSSTSNEQQQLEAWIVEHGTASPPPGVDAVDKNLGTGCMWPVREAAVPPGGSASLSLADGGIRFADGSAQNTAVEPAAAPPRRSGQTRCYDSGGTPVSCAGRGHDGELQPGVEWPVPRYTDNLDGTATDELTDLVWLKEVGCLGTTNTFEEAGTQTAALNGGSELNCTDYTAGTFDDWRVPGITELMSMLDYGTPSGMPPGHPFDFTGISACGFWSSTSNAATPTEGWWLIHGAVALDRVVERVPKTTNGCVWVVRDGEG